MTLALQAAPRPILEALRAQLAPRFANEQQRNFFNCYASEVLYSGAYRAGKSRIGCEKAYWLAKHYPGIPIGIFRKTAASLAASTERTLLHDVIPRGVIARHNRTERWYELANGSRIWMFGLDPDPITGLPSKVGSVELGWAFVDEAAEVTESDWSMVKGRLSWPGIPYHQIAAATNPASPKHWLKVRFTPPTEDRVYLHASTFDNPLLPADYVEDARKGAEDYLKRRYIYGEWVGAEGVIWSLPDAQVKWPETAEWKRVVAGVDWGFVHAFACEVVGQSGTGRLAVIDEVYEKGQTIDQIIPALQIVREKHNVATFYADPSEPAYILQCQRAGLPMEPANNAVGPGIGAVSTAIAKGMTVAPSCAGLLGELPGYTWAKDRQGGFREVPIEINDDACLVAGTMIATEDGEVPIERVTIGMRVWTRDGLHRVTDAALTDADATVVDLPMANGRTVRCTPNHRIMTQDGWMRADALRYDDVVCIRPLRDLRHAAYGPLLTARSQTAGTSITATETSRTTPWTTLSVSARAITHTVTSNLAVTAQRLVSSISTVSDPSRQRGTQPTLAYSYTVPTGTLYGWIGRVSSVSVSTAERPINVMQLTAETGSVRTAVRLQAADLPGSTTLSASAHAASRSASTTTQPSGSARVAVEVSQPEAVYNLTVEGSHEYFANGVLTHNCDALRYAVVALDRGFDDNPWAQLAGQRVGGVA